jgi:hypothetical protein
LPLRQPDPPCAVLARTRNLPKSCYPPPPPRIDEQPPAGNALSSDNSGIPPGSRPTKRPEPIAMPHAGFRKGIDGLRESLTEVLELGSHHRDERSDVEDEVKQQSCFLGRSSARRGTPVFPAQPEGLGGLPACASRSRRPARLRDLINVPTNRASTRKVESHAAPNRPTRHRIVPSAGRNLLSRPREHTRGIAERR